MKRPNILSWLSQKLRYQSSPKKVEAAKEVKNNKTTIVSGVRRILYLFQSLDKRIIYNPKSTIVNDLKINILGTIKGKIKSLGKKAKGTKKVSPTTILKINSIFFCILLKYVILNGRESAVGWRPSEGSHVFTYKFISCAAAESGYNSLIFFWISAAFCGWLFLS